MTYDRQFSIPSPFPEEGEAQTRIMIDCYGGGDFLINVNGESIRFEFSERFGPMPLTKRGAERKLGPCHCFWRAVSLWNLQGRRLDDNKAIWHEPKKPVLTHLGGQNYLVIENGEPGYDW